MYPHPAHIAFSEGGITICNEIISFVQTIWKLSLPLSTLHKSIIQSVHLIPVRLPVLLSLPGWQPDCHQLWRHHLVSCNTAPNAFQYTTTTTTNYCLPTHQIWLIIFLTQLQQYSIFYRSIIFYLHLYFNVFQLLSPHSLYLGVSRIFDWINIKACIIFRL